MISMVMKRQADHITEDDITYIVKDIIHEKLGLDKILLTDQADYKNDLGVDSLDLIELQMEFEKKFAISIRDEEVEKLTTVGKTIAFIKDKHKN
jgi:acyl carrier protein